MKRFLSTLTAVALVVLAVVTLTACSDDDDNDQKCYFTLGMEEMNITGPSEEYTEIQQYLGEVFEAYNKACGFTSDDSSLILDGDYDTLCKQMRDKFNSVQIPASPKLEGSYTFTIVLRGCRLSSNITDVEKMDVVASQTISYK